jgi:hypothetical protein
METKFVFLFSLQLLSETFLILRRNERDIKKASWPSCRLPGFLVDFNGKRISGQISKNTRIKFHENPSRESPVFLYGRTRQS